MTQEYEIERSRLDNLIPHPDAIIGDPKELINIDVMAEWEKINK